MAGAGSDRQEDEAAQQYGRWYRFFISVCAFCRPSERVSGAVADVKSRSSARLSAGPVLLVVVLELPVALGSQLVFHACKASISRLQKQKVRAQVPLAARHSWGTSRAACPRNSAGQNAGRRCLHNCV